MINILNVEIRNEYIEKGLSLKTKFCNIKSAQIFEKECAYLSKNNKL